MLNAVKYILAVLFTIGGGALALYKLQLGGGMSIQDWISASLLVVGGAGYILYSVPGKLLNLIKNVKLPTMSRKAKVVQTTIEEDRAALDYLMKLGIEYNNKLIMDAVVSMNNEIFKLRHSVVKDK